MAELDMLDLDAGIAATENGGILLMARYEKRKNNDRISSDVSEHSSL
jgi:hypothetical protein